MHINAPIRNHFNWSYMLTSHSTSYLFTISMTVIPLNSYLMYMMWSTTTHHKVPEIFGLHQHPFLFDSSSTDSWGERMAARTCSSRFITWKNWAPRKIFFDRSVSYPVAIFNTRGRGRRVWPSVSYPLSIFYLNRKIIVLCFFL